MLSDKFYKKEYSDNSGVSEKIAKLEELIKKLFQLFLNFFPYD